MLKIWSFGFWSPAPDAVQDSGRPPRRAAGLLVIVGDGPLMEILWAALPVGGDQRMVDRFPLATAAESARLCS